MIKECNVLGSGPSRKSYVPNDLPTIGCNFPWTKVNWTLMFDYQPLMKYFEDASVFPPNLQFIVSKHCYDYLKKQNLLHKIEDRIISIFNKHKLVSVEFSGSSGHYAAEWMIHRGFTKLNLYGMDNYFGDILCKDNFCHLEGADHYIDNVTKNALTESQLLKRGLDWQLAWKRIIKYNPNVEFNFVR